MLLSIVLMIAAPFAITTNSIQNDSFMTSVQSTILMIQQTVLQVLNKITRINNSKSYNNNNTTYQNKTMDSLGNVQSTRKMKKKISGIHPIY